MRTWISMNGLSNMSYLLNIIFILMILFIETVYSESHLENETISLEFLEFLADWETNQGDWVGPEKFEDDSFDQLYEVEEENVNEPQE
jgi:hypothetical protein